MNLSDLLAKLDYRLSGQAFSRAQYQVELLVRKLEQRLGKRVEVLLDIGGGWPPQYKGVLTPLTKRYLNLEIKKGPGTDIVGSVYDIPRSKESIDIATLFMVMEHLNEPQKALNEVARVLKKRGYVLLTTVQYWHTHNHPSDYLRYTKAGLEYFCKNSGLKVVSMWSMGGPFLVIFHAIELNLPGLWRTLFSILFYRLADWLDWKIYGHTDTRKESDSVGWSLIAQKI